MGKKIDIANIHRLSTGSTLLNLILDGGFLPGHYYHIVGDSSSGKTFLCNTIFAEASIDPAFKNYKLIYDDTEGGNLFDWSKLFGASMAERLEAPSYEEGDPECPQHSTSVEEFYYHLDDAVQEGVPFLYMLDSMDGMDSEEDRAKFTEQKEAHRAGKTVSGSYGASTAKANSRNIRRAISSMKKTGSILIVINQTRMNLGFGFKSKTRSGGTSLEFYAAAEIWTSVKGSLKKTVKGKQRKIGKLITVSVEKNRLGGRESKVDLEVYPEYGVDDIGSCVDFLVEEGVWKKTGRTIKATDFEQESSRELLIRWIEKKNKEKDLSKLVQTTWAEIAKASSPNRKPRYAKIGSS